MTKQLPLLLLAFGALSLTLACGGGGGGGGSASPCENKVVGEECGGGIYAGDFSTYKLVTTPGNCTDSATPTCDGGTDTVQKLWAAASHLSGATSLNNGKSNTTTTIAYHSDIAVSTPAASFCDNLEYGGQTDWYLPARNELEVLFDNNADVGGFDTSGTEYYWTSSEITDGTSFRAAFDAWSPAAAAKSNSELVRCVRRSQ